MRRDAHGDGDGRPDGPNGQDGSAARNCGELAAAAGQNRQRLGAPEGQPAAGETVGPLRQAGRAAKANLLPAIFLWAAAAAIILAYSFIPAVRETLDKLAKFKKHGGYAFSAISTPIFAALLPLLIQRLARACGSRSIRPEPWRNLPLLLAFWAYRGAEIDGLYRFQEWLWGKEQTVWTLAGQVAVDQGLYVLVWAIPTMVIVFLFKDSGYSLGCTRRGLGKRWYRNRCVPILVVNWVVWVPVVMVIYSMPPGLKIPVMNINVCLFMLLVMFLTRDATEVGTVPQLNGPGASGEQ